MTQNHTDPWPKTLKIKNLPAHKQPTPSHFFASGAGRAIDRRGTAALYAKGPVLVSMCGKFS